MDGDRGRRWPEYPQRGAPRAGRPTIVRRFENGAAAPETGVLPGTPPAPIERTASVFAARHTTATPVPNALAGCAVNAPAVGGPGGIETPYGERGRKSVLRFRVWTRKERIGSIQRLPNVLRAGKAEAGARRWWTAGGGHRGFLGEERSAARRRPENRGGGGGVRSGGDPAPAFQRRRGFGGLVRAGPAELHHRRRPSAGRPSSPGPCRGGARRISQPLPCGPVRFPPRRPAAARRCSSGSVRDPSAPCPVRTDAVIGPNVVIDGNRVRIWFRVKFLPTVADGAVSIGSACPEGP